MYSVAIWAQSVHTFEVSQLLVVCMPPRLLLRKPAVRTTMKVLTTKKNAHGNGKLAIKHPSGDLIVKCKIKRILKTPAASIEQCKDEESLSEMSSSWWYWSSPSWWGSLEDSMAFTAADNQAPPLTLNDGPQPLIKQATDKAKMALQSLQALKTRLIETISCAEDEGGDAKSFMDKTLKGKTDYVETLIKGYESIIQTKRIKDALGAPQPTTPQDIRNKMRADSKVADTLKAHITVVQGMLQS